MRWYFSMLEDWLRSLPCLEADLLCTASLSWITISPLFVVMSTIELFALISTAFLDRSTDLNYILRASIFENKYRCKNKLNVFIMDEFSSNTILRKRFRIICCSNFYSFYLLFLVFINAAIPSDISSSFNNF